MKAIPWRVQIGVVVAGYLSVAAISAFLIVARYELYVKHPEDVAAAGGMYAAGDWMLAIFIAGMLLVATMVLVVVIRGAEPAYTRYAQVLFGLSLTAPLSLIMLSIPAIRNGTSLLGYLWEWRIEVSPVVLVGFVISRLAARFKRAKRLTSYAIAVEVLSLGFVIAAFLMMGH